jgi:IS5 family transposase
MSQLGLFDIDNRLRALSALQDPLETLQKRIPWESFRKELDRALRKPTKSNTGRPPYDSVLMFKILVLQSLYGLSDHQVEFQIKDRLSFMRFLGLHAENRIPDEKTVWAYRETLAEGGHIEDLFERFEEHLQETGYQAKKGMIVDATLVEVPRQRNTKEENEAIKEGKTPETLSENPNVLSQKDLDARWTQKRGQNYYGYKDHVCVDAEHKMIRRFTVTPAHVHDSVELENLLDPWNKSGVVYGDSAYGSQEKETDLGKLGYRFRFNEKGQRGRPLTEKQKRRNRRMSRVRARVEHVFGWMEQKTGGILMRGIGLVRAKARIGLRNLVYNMSRFAYLEGAV